MIRIYGGTVTEGLNDGVEVGTEENPILFDGLYPAPNGEAIKEMRLAIRTDGEIIPDVCVIVAMLNSDGKDIDLNGEIYTIVSTNYNGYTSFYTPGKIFFINPQTLLIKELNATNQIFSIKAKAKGTEDLSNLPDLRGKISILPVKNIWNKLA